MNHGKAYVFYPEASDGRTTVALLLAIDPIDLARGKAGSGAGWLFDYVNDRPYVSSSFLSTAISKVFGTAMTGRADAYQHLSDSALDLTANVTMLPCRGETDKLNKVFEPLGYAVSYESFVTDENFPDWGDSQYVNLPISGRVRLRDLLKHLYVLVPVFDGKKHYWVGADEVDKLLRHGEDWLAAHPERRYITGRYLNRRKYLVNMAYERLVADSDGEVPVAEDEEAAVKPEKLSLKAQRLGSVVAALKNCGAKRVIDLGCGEGYLIGLLIKERQFAQITGVDVSHANLAIARDKLRLEHAGDSMLERVQLLHGSVTYKDARFGGFDAACVVEVIEHLDIPRLAAFERVLFEFAKPPTVVLTTPNKEYNANYANLRDDLRYGDHRFEWTRTQFREWANKTAEKFGYAVLFSEIGDACETHGAPTQIGVFTICV